MVDENVKKQCDTLLQLQSDLADNLTAKGVEASKEEKFNSLVTKVLDIETGAKVPDEWSEEYYQSVLAEVPTWDEIYAERDSSWLPFTEGGENTATGLFLVDKNNIDSVLEIGYVTDTAGTPYSIYVSTDGETWDLINSGTIAQANTTGLWIELSVKDIITEDAMTSDGQYQFLVRFECEKLTRFRFGRRFEAGTDYRKVKLVEADWNLPHISYPIAINLDYGLNSRRHLEYVHNYIVGDINLTYSFYDCRTLKCVKNIKTSATETSLTQTFYNCVKLRNIPFIEANVTNMSKTFYSCLKIITIPKLNFSEVENIEQAFEYCSKLKTIPYIEITNSSIRCNGIFGNCYSLELLPEIFKDCKIANLNRTFSECYGLKKLPQLGDLSTCTDYSNLLNRCIALEGVILKLNTSNAGVNACANLYASSTQVIEIYGMLITNTSSVVAPSNYTRRYTFNSDRIPESTITINMGNGLSMSKEAIIEMLESLPTITVAKTIRISDMLCYTDLSETDIAIATEKGWTVA